MYFATTAAAIVALGSGLSSAIPTIRQANTLSACANITQQYQQARAANATSYYADGQLAANCLLSMPFDAARASAFVLELKKYIQFQSTIPVLKNPPKTYLSPAVDLLGGLDAIYKKANTSQYRSQFQMDTEIYNLIYGAADGHLSAQLCSTTVMTFGLEATSQIVSVSADGIALPKLYLVTDAFRLRNNSNAAVSDIVQINGQDAVQYLTKLGPLSRSQDPDAQYNNMMASEARVGQTEPQGGFFVTQPWPGKSVIPITFRNGTTKNARVVATVPRNFNYTSGTALYRQFCLPPTTTSSSSSSSSTPTATSTPTSIPPPAAYPYPVIRDPNNLILGYYLNGTGYNDTAVLFVPSFSPVGVSGAKYFAYVASTFVNRAAADGKTKMIVDVSGNPGGQINAGFDLFKLFFPNMSAYSATRQRDHEAQRLTWKALSTLNGTEGSDYTDLFDYKQQVTPDQMGDYSSWEAIYGPDNINGANMTNIYANFNFSSAADEAPIRGYGGVPLNVTRQLFKPENILVLSDGFCASTCTTFVNLMTNSTSFGNARSIAFGGRPTNAPMQIMGGVRGAQAYEFENLVESVGLAYGYAYNQTNTSRASLTKQELANFANVAPIAAEDFPLRLYGGGLNLRNSYNPTDLKTPLQFSYQAAGCKLFYTVENVFSPATSWKAAAYAAWGSGGKCVNGSQAAGFSSSS